MEQHGEMKEHVDWDAQKIKTTGRSTFDCPI
jgi:hypothetical protein